MNIENMSEIARSLDIFQRDGGNMSEVRDTLDTLVAVKLFTFLTYNKIINFILVRISGENLVSF
jgi:hypothetical protein